MIIRATAGAAGVLALLPCLLSAPPSDPEFRLPLGVTPLLHRVELTIDPRADSFRGRMSIDMRIDIPTDKLWLHAKNLRIAATNLIVDGRAVAVRAGIDGDEFLEVIPSEPLLPGVATLSIDYTGLLDATGTAGLYRRKVGPDWYALGLFPPIEARRAMPCFDEPRFKTPWRVTLRVRESDEAFSNAPVEAAEVEQGGWKRITFAETEPLAAELLGIAVGPFEANQAGAVRVLTTRGSSTRSEFAANSATPILRALEQYTGEPYRFGKIDLVAMPGLPFEGVETPGLIALHERNLLTQPAGETAARREAIEELLAHEFAHQWFGNLVTQSGWRDVWLSEGAATWLSRKILGREALALQRREILMREDEAGRARVVRQPVRNRAESQDAYNVVVYEKGAAVLTMLEGWLGEAPLRDALRQYLAAHRFGIASTDDLERQLPAEAREVLDLFLGSTGVPVVAGEVDCGRPRPALKVASTLSPVPVCWRTDTASGCNVVHTIAAIELPEGSACPAWVQWNAGGTGYYRTFSTQANAAAALPHLSIAEKLTLAHDLRATRSPGWRELIDTLLHDPAGAVSAAASDALRR